MDTIIKKIKTVLKNPWKIFQYLAYKGFFNWMSDEMFIKLLFRSEMGKKIDLSNPKTFNEKIQWLKINDRKNEYTSLVDKLKVREYVAKRVGSDYLPQIYGVFEKIELKDLDHLPNKFVIKANHDSGSVLLCNDKKLIKEKQLKKLNKSLKKNYFYVGREWPYKNIKPLIIVEEFLSAKDKDDLLDYKLFCFEGEVKMIQVMSERNKGSFLLNHFDVEWNELDYQRVGIQRNNVVPSKPIVLDEMIDVARKLSKNLEFVRVDLYVVENRIYFGELTFYPVTGLMRFVDPKIDLMLGKLINIQKKGGTK